MKEILARVVDGSRFDEYKPEYGKTMICGYARIGGFAVGIVANQKLHAQQTDHEGHKRRRVRRRDLYRVGGKGRALHHGLQPESDSAGVLPRCERIHGGTRCRVERALSKRARRW